MDGNDLLRMNIVQRRTGLSRSSIYAMMKQGNFPHPIRIGKRAVRWEEAAIAEFIQNRKSYGLIKAMGRAGSHLDNKAE